MSASDLPSERDVTELAQRFDHAAVGSLDWYRAGDALARELGEVHEHGGDAGALDRAIAVRRSLLDRGGLAGRSRDVVASNLGYDLSRRFQIGGDDGDLRAAIDLGTSVLATDDPALWAATRVNVAARLMLAYDQLDEPAALDRAIALFGEAADAEDAPPSDRFAALANLSGALGRRFERDGRMAGLDEACARAAEAVEMAPGDATFAQSTWAGHELTRYQVTGDLDALTRAQQLAEAAVEASTDALAHAHRLHLLAQIAMTRFDETGDADDLRVARDAAAQAVGLSPAASAGRATYELTRATVEYVAFEHGEGRDALDGAVSHAETSQRSLLSARGPMAWAVTNQLVLMLLTRYELDGNSADLDRAIAEAERTLASPLPDETRPALLLNTTHGLSLRHARDGDVGDLEGALGHARAAVAETPDASTTRALRLAALSAALAELAEATGDAHLVEEAVRRAREALAHEAVPSASRHVYQTALANRLTDRDAPGDADEAIDLLDAALAALVAGSLHAAVVGFDLGRLLLLRSERMDLSADTRATARRQAIGRLSDVVGSAWPEPAMKAAHMLTNTFFEAGDWSECERVAAAAIDAAADMLKPRAQDPDRERARLEAQGTGAVAALAAQRARHADRVPAYIEATSAVLRRTPGTPSEPAHGGTQRRRTAAGGEPGVVDAHRADLRAVAAAIGVPVVFLATTKVGGVGAVVRDSGPIDTFDLPAATDPAIERALDELRFTFAASSEPDEWSTAVEELLATTWRMVGRALADRLSQDAIACIVPLGRIGWLPIGTARAGGDSLLATTATFVASSAAAAARHAPVSSAGSAAPAARRAPAGNGPRTPCVVAHPGPHDRHLRALDDEVACLRRVLPACRVWPDAWPTRDEGEQPVITPARLRRSDWAGDRRRARRSVLPRELSSHLTGADLVHVACHLDLAFPDPRESVLQVGDALEFQALAAAPVRPGAHAVLSACDSGVMGATLPDESLGPVSLLLAERFGSVVAALWPIDDSGVPAFIDAYYRHLTTAATPVDALAATQRGLAREPAHVWAAFVHHSG